VILGVSVLFSAACSGSPTQSSPPPPELKITCPASVSMQSPTGQPVAVQYGSATTTGGTPPVNVACSPPSGSAFTIGSTTVTCTANDQKLRTDSCTLTVTVTSPPKLSVTSFVAFGDSMTAGEVPSEGYTGAVRPLKVDPALSYPTDLQADLRSRYTAQSISVANAGVPRETTSEGAHRLPGVLALGYQVLLLLEGANDLPNVNGALANMQAMVATASQRGVKVFLATLPPQNPVGTCTNGVAPNGQNAALVPPYNAGLVAIAEGQNVPLVDVYRAFGGTPSPDLIDCDGLHPTPKGYQLIADTFFAAIKQTLELPAATTTSLVRRRR